MANDRYIDFLKRVASHDGEFGRAAAEILKREYVRDENGRFAETEGGESTSNQSTESESAQIASVQKKIQELSSYADDMTDKAISAGTARAHSDAAEAHYQAANALSQMIVGLKLSNDAKSMCSDAETWHRETGENHDNAAYATANGPQEDAKNYANGASESRDEAVKATSLALEAMSKPAVSESK